MRRNWLLVAAVFGFLAVAAGAFGAHALKDRLSPDELGWWQTAAHYHLAHAIVLALVGVLAGRDDPSRTHLPSRPLDVAGAAFALGIVVFSGSLYALALTGLKALGAVTPFGGLLLLVGWGALAVAAWKRGPQRS